MTPDDPITAEALQRIGFLRDHMKINSMKGNILDCLYSGKLVLIEELAGIWKPQEIDYPGTLVQAANAFGTLRDVQILFRHINGRPLNLPQI